MIVINSIFTLPGLFKSLSELGLFLLEQFSIIEKRHVHCKHFRITNWHHWLVLSLFFLAVSSISYVVGEELLKALVKKVLEVNKNVKILTAVVQNLSSQNNESTSHTLPDEINLPLSTPEEVDELEEYFLENTDILLL